MTLKRKVSPWSPVQTRPGVILTPVTQWSEWGSYERIFFFCLKSCVNTSRWKITCEWYIRRTGSKRAMMLFLQSLPFFLHTTLGSFVVVLLSWSMNIVGILIPVLSFLPHRRRRWKNLGHMVCRHIDVFMTRTPCFFRFATRNLPSQDKDCGVVVLGFTR